MDLTEDDVSEEEMHNRKVIEEIFGMPFEQAVELINSNQLPDRVQEMADDIEWEGNNEMIVVIGKGATQTAPPAVIYMEMIENV